MKNTSEQLLSFAENELMQKESIRRAVLSEAPAKQKKPVAWTKILLPIAACLVLAVGTVFLIPSARAEVMRWLGVANPAVDYLTEPEHVQTPVDQLILPAEQTQEPGEDPAEPAKTQEPCKVLYAADEPIWQQIAADFSAAPREAFFDGEALHLSLTLRGLSALPSLDSLTGGGATAYDEDTPAYIFLKLPDGAELSCGPISGLDREPGFDSYLRTLNGMRADQISASNIEWLNDRELIGAVKCSVINPRTGKGVGTVQIIDGKEIEIPDVWALLSANADEIGILTADVLYRTAVDTENGLMKLLEADLGTIKVDLHAFERLDRNTLSPESKEIAWSGTIVLSAERQTEESAAITVTNTAVDCKGLIFRIEGGQIDALGVDDLAMTVTMPNEWTAAEQEAFLHSLSFRTETDDEVFIGGSFTVESVGSGTYRLVYRNRQLPYERLASMQALRLIPVLIHRTAVRTDSGLIPIPLNHPIEGTAWEGEDTEYPQYAITLHVN